MVNAGAGMPVGVCRHPQVDSTGKLFWASDLYQPPTRIQDSVSEDAGRSPMSRFKAAESILKAAEYWKWRCLLEEKSLFTEWSLWTREGFDELHELYVERSKDGLSVTLYLSQLEDKLKPGEPEASCLWAEMTWVFHLIQSSESMKAATKRARIRENWDWSGRSFPADHDLLSDDVLGAGVANTGRAYNTHMWREIRFFADAMLQWFSLEIGEREFLLHHPWEYASWLDAGKFAKKRMFRHVLLFLLFPDEFEPIATDSIKSKIVKVLGSGNRWDPTAPVAIDKELLAIRQRLPATRTKVRIAGRGPTQDRPATAPAACRHTGTAGSGPCPRRPAPGTASRTTVRPGCPDPH